MTSQGEWRPCKVHSDYVDVYGIYRGCTYYPRRFNSWMAAKEFAELLNLRESR
jgi:hypothetical protein